METVDQIERNGEFFIDGGRGLDMKLGGGVLLRDRESAELDHPSALAEHGAEGFEVRWVSEPDSLGRLVNIDKISSLLGPHKVRDCKDPPKLSRRVGDRKLDLVFTFFDLSWQRASEEEWRRK